MAYTTINKPNNYFDTKLYTGNAPTGQNITGLNFKPDFTWIKCRTDVYDHRVFDAIRGVEKELYTNNSSAEGTASGSLTSFNTDGFSLGSWTPTNSNGQTFASWNWLGANTTVSNTQGSITSTVSANTTSGFSIVTWTASANANIGHGLGGKPDFIITKSRTDVPGWVGWHSALTGGNENDRYIYFNTSGSGTTPDYWSGTNGITSTTFGVKNSGYDNNNGNMVAYCFRSIKGFSKFGGYTGNGSTDGTFVYTGMRPAWLMIKRTDAAGYSWMIIDNKRNSYNVMGKGLFPEDSSTEYDYTTVCDFLSNGFKMKDSGGGRNASGGKYIYMTFAENPLVGTNNVPATAR